MTRFSQSTEELLEDVYPGLSKGLAKAQNERCLTTLDFLIKDYRRAQETHNVAALTGVSMNDLRFYRRRCRVFDDIENIKLGAYDARERLKRIRRYMSQYKWRIEDFSLSMEDLYHMTDISSYVAAVSQITSLRTNFRDMRALMERKEQLTKEQKNWLLKDHYIECLKDKFALFLEIEQAIRNGEVAWEDLKTDSDKLLRTIGTYVRLKRELRETIS